MFVKFVKAAQPFEPATELKTIPSSLQSFSLEIPLMTPVIARHVLYWTDSIFW